MSSCVVTLKLRSEPITKVTGMPAASATAASSVSSPPATLRMRLQDSREMERLRRLRAPQVAPVDGIADPLARAALDRVDHRHRDQDGRMLRQRRDGAADRAGIDQRPRGVVDQHVVRPLGGKPLQAVQHRALPRRAAIDRRQQLGDAGGGRVIEIALRGMDRDHDARDARDARRRSPGCGAACGLPASVWYCFGRSPPKR